jgi:hypothetical protein
LSHGGIIPVMKRILLALLITITAFRGLVGDVMATEMSAMKTAPASVSQSVSEAVPAEPATPMASAMPCHSAGEEEASVGSLSGCKTCQVCHLSACITPSLIVVAQDLRLSAPALFHESFASAEPLHFAKPPIL